MSQSISSHNRRVWQKIATEMMALFTAESDRT